MRDEGGAPVGAGLAPPGTEPEFHHAAGNGAAPDSVHPVFGRRVALAAGAGALLAAGFPPYSVPALLPVGIGLLLLALEGLTPRQGAYAGLACGAVYFGATLFWLANIFGAAAVSLIAIAAAFPALFGAAYAFVRRSLPAFPAWLAAAVLWTGIEYYRSEPFVLNFGWMGLGYGVINAPLLARCAALFGSYGLSFGIVTLGALVARLLARRDRRALAWLGAAAALWPALLYTPLPAPHPDHPLRVRLVQAPSEDDEDQFGLSRPTPGLAAPDVIVWPEYSFVSDPKRQPKLWARLQDVARANHAWFIFGAKDELDPANDAAFRNTAYVLSPNGALVGTHVKNHPVHFIRDGIAGTQARPIATPLDKLGVAICFDMDYPDVARRLAQGGAEVFLVPNDDPREWGPAQQAQHRLMFQMRAAECGRWLARADVAGGTSVAAPSGQEVARVTTNEPARLDAVVGRETVRTLFVRGGWRFGQACLAAGILLVAAGLLRRRC